MDHQWWDDLIRTCRKNHPYWKNHFHSEGGGKSTNQESLRKRVRRRMNNKDTPGRWPPAKEIAALFKKYINKYSEYTYDFRYGMEGKYKKTLGSNHGGFITGFKSEDEGVVCSSINCVLYSHMDGSKRTDKGEFYITEATKVTEPSTDRNISWNPGYRFSGTDFEKRLSTAVSKFFNKYEC